MLSQPNRGLIIGTLLLLQILGSCWCDVTVSLKFMTYRNSASRLSSGGKCDALFGVRCDHFFVICIDKLDGDQTSSRRFSECVYDKWTTAEFRNMDTITFDHDLHGVQNPITVIIPNAEKGVLLKVQVWDDDTSKRTGHEHVDDLIYRYVIGDTLVKNQSIANDHVFQRVIEGSRSENIRTSLTVGFSAYCSKYYYMVNGVCSKYCKPTNDKTGHYFCTPEGNITCRQGWVHEATNCTVAKENCLNRACKNDGVCTGGSTSFTCNCTSGFKGVDCSEDIDECSQGVCVQVNADRCENKPGGYKCVCKNNYIDDLCQNYTRQIYTRQESLNATDELVPKSVVGGSQGGGYQGNGVIIGLIVAMCLLLLIILVLVALLLGERRKRHLAEKGTNTMAPTLTTLASVDTGVGTTHNVYGAEGGNANLYNSDNIRNQRAAQAQTGNGVHLGHNAKMMEAALMGMPSVPNGARHLSTEAQTSPGFDNPSYSNEFEFGAVASNRKEHIYEEPNKVKRFIRK